MGLGLEGRPICFYSVFLPSTKSDPSTMEPMAHGITERGVIPVTFLGPPSPTPSPTLKDITDSGLLAALFFWFVV